MPSGWGGLAAFGGNPSGPGLDVFGNDTSSGSYFNAGQGVGSTAGGGDVKQLPFQKKTSSKANMSMLDPAFEKQLANLQQAAPDYSSYFTKLSNQSFEDANRQSARLSAQHGGAPTASTGQTGQNQGAYQGMLFDQLNKSNVDRMWNTQDAWETNKYNQGASAYKDYFNAIADKSFDTEESGFTSGIYTPRGGGGSSNPYANSTFGTYGDQGNKIQGAPPISGAGGTGYTGGGAPLGEWGTQAYNPQNPYMGMGDVSAPGYGQQNGPGWLNQQQQWQSNDDLPSYLQDIASQNPYAGLGDWQ